MKKILIVLCFFLLVGCSNTKEDKPLIIKDNKENIIETKEEYHDDNPIKLGLFLYDGKYASKKVIKNEYYADFTNGKDIGSFEVFLTSDEEVSGSSFKDTWNKYYNMYEDISNYKIGYNIKFMLDNGENYSSNFLEPDIFKYSPYFYVYLYDDIHVEDGKIYSHLEEVNDNTLITSIKLYAVDNIDRVESIILSAFTYDSENDFDEDGNYRGNSLYVIRIKRK